MPVTTTRPFTSQTTMGNKVFSFCLVLLVTTCAFGQKKMPQELPPKNGTKATLVRVANLYIQPDESADRVGIIAPGREMVIAERSGHWLRVFANIDAPESRKADEPVMEQDQQVIPISGWMLDKGIVDTTTPHGDAILFGEAISAENAASDPHPPSGAALEARLLYRRVVEMFPQSPLTPEAMWRAADVRWQLQKADASTLPSAHEKENYLREQMDEDEMKKIEKYFPPHQVGRLRRLSTASTTSCAATGRVPRNVPRKKQTFTSSTSTNTPTHPALPRLSTKRRGAWLRPVICGLRTMTPTKPRRPALAPLTSPTSCSRSIRNRNMLRALPV